MSTASWREALDVVTILMVGHRLSDFSPGVSSEGAFASHRPSPRAVPETPLGLRHQQPQTVTQASFYSPPPFQPLR